MFPGQSPGFFISEGIKIFISEGIKVLTKSGSYFERSENQGS